MTPRILDFSYQRTARVAAALLLAASLSIIATDLVSTSFEARDHGGILRTGLDAIGAPAGVERRGVVQAHKARLASVGATYFGQVTTERAFPFYGAALVARGWALCGRSGTAAYEKYCRGDYRARVSWPSVEGSGTYSVSLNWNRITLGIWLTGIVLLVIVSVSGSILLSGLPPTRLPPWLRARARFLAPRAGTRSIS